MGVHVEQAKYWTYDLELLKGCVPYGRGCDECGFAVRIKKKGKRNDIRRYLDYDNRYNGRVQLNDGFRICPDRQLVYRVRTDLFNERVPDAYIIAAYTKMLSYKKSAFVVPTRRIERAVEFYRENRSFISRKEAPVYLVLKACDQEETRKIAKAVADLRGKHRIALALDPLLERPKFHPGIFTKMKDPWLIVCGESGFNPRPLMPAWVKTCATYCRKHDIRFWFQHWGMWMELGNVSKIRQRLTRLAWTAPWNHITIPRNLGCTLLVKMRTQEVGYRLKGRSYIDAPEEIRERKKRIAMFQEPARLNRRRVFEKILFEKNLEVKGE